MKRRILSTSSIALIIAAVLTSAGSWAAAQPSYPVKPIRLIVPTSAGGSIDTVARVIGEQLTSEFGQPVIVENKTGAGGMIAASAVSHAPPDGYTLLVTHTGVLQADLLRKNPSYRLSDLDPVPEGPNTPVVFAVGGNEPVEDLKGFISLAKAEPDKLSYGSYGKGTSAHIWAEQFSQRAGIRLMHVPYSGEMPALQDLLAGRITSGWGSVGTYKQYADARKIRILALANPVRSVLLPEVPTFIEAGFPEMNASGWSGVFAPVGTPKAVLDKLSRAIVSAAQNPDIAPRILATGQEPTGAGQEAFGKRVAHDRQTWAKAISDFKITLD